MPRYMVLDGILYTQPEFQRIHQLIQQGKTEEAKPLMKRVLAKHKGRMHEQNQAALIAAAPATQDAAKIVWPVIERKPRRHHFSRN